MNETESPSTQNASLHRYSTAPDATDADAEVETDTSEEPLISVSELDDSHVQDLVTELDDDEIRGLVESMLDAKNIVYAVAEVTDNEELASNIDSVTDHYADRPSLVEAAGDYIADAFGMRPFDLTITEPDDEYLTPMISLDVEDDVVLTENPDINAELVAHATRMEGVTESGQRRQFNEWRDAIGGERVAEFKRDRHPNALGFSLPGHIPATGDEDGRTPVTEIPYIGEATATDMHPGDELMSVEDYLSLTEKQHAWIDMPVDNKEYGNRRVRGIARGIVELSPDQAGEALGRALGMMDRRDSDGMMEWVNPANTFGVTADDSAQDADDVAPIASTSTDDGDVTVELDTGVEQKYSADYWQLLEAIAESTETVIKAGGETPASLQLPDGTFVIVAPIESDNNSA
jgi:hypothetical protein